MGKDRNFKRNLSGLYLLENAQFLLIFFDRLTPPLDTEEHDSALIALYVL